MEIKIIKWQARPTSKAGSGFYPATKFIGRVIDENGLCVAETGKCAGHASAYNRALYLRGKL